MIVLISVWGTAAPLLARMRLDGEKVVMYITSSYPRKKEVQRGIVPQVYTLQDALDCIRQPGSVVLFDSTGKGAFADEISLLCGGRVWGASTLAYQMEHDRGEAMRVLNSCGIRIPQTVVVNPEGPSIHEDPFWQVKTTQEAINIARHGGTWYVKPYGGGSGETVKCDSVHMLEEYLKDNRAKPPYLLQKQVKGVEVSTEVWVYEGEIIPHTANGTIETKRFLAGDLGPHTGSETSTVWGYEDVPRILRETMGCGAFREWLRRPVFGGKRYGPYTGPLDLNCIVDETNHKPYALEFTPRMGWSAYIALAELLGGEGLGDIFRQAASGVLQGLKWKYNYAYCVKLSVPPYPVSNELNPDENMGIVYDRLMKMCEGLEVEGPLSSPHIWWNDVRRSLVQGQRVGPLEVAGVDGNVADVAGTGRTIEEARDAAHALFDEIHVPNKQGRVFDGADRAIRDTARLAAWGYEIGGKQ